MRKDTMRGNSIFFLWVAIVRSNVPTWATNIDLEADIADISEAIIITKSGVNTRNSQSNRIRGTGDIAEHSHYRYLFSASDLPERKDPPTTSKDKYKMRKNEETWRDRLFPPTLSPSPTSSPTRLQDRAGYFQERNRSLRIACAGDSLTLGTFGDSPWSLSYPERLNAMLGPGHDFLNLGANGATAFRGLRSAYVETTEFQRSLSWKPDIYLLMLGTNDSKYWENNGRRKFQTDMEFIVKEVRRAAPEVRILVAIPPWVQKDGNGIRNDVLVNSIQPSIQAFARVERLQVVDMYQPTVNQPDRFIYDGLHLSAKGYRKLAEAWLTAIQCNENGACEAGETCSTCPSDCYLNCQ